MIVCGEVEGEPEGHVEAEGRLAAVGDECRDRSDGDVDVRWSWRYRLHCRWLGCTDHVSSVLPDSIDHYYRFEFFILQFLSCPIEENFRWSLHSPDGVAPSWMVGVSASVNLPLHHKVGSCLLARLSSGTDSPGWSRKKGCKTVVLCVCSVGRDMLLTVLATTVRNFLKWKDMMHWIPHDMGNCGWLYITWTDTNWKDLEPVGTTLNERSNLSEINWLCVIFLVRIKCIVSYCFFCM